MYKQVRSPHTEHAASRLPNPTHLEGRGGGTIWPGSRPAGGYHTQSANSNECLLTRSMLIKMYVCAIYSRFHIGTILSIRKHGYGFITTLSLSSLMSPSAKQKEKKSPR